MRRQTVFIQLFLTLIALLGFTIVATGFMGIRSLRSYAEADAGDRQLELVQTLIALYPPRSGADEAAAQQFLTQLPGSLGYRITIVDPDGRVLGDSHENVEVMDNHSNRPEIQQALTNRRGYSIRRSATLGELLIYTAYYDRQTGLIFRVARTVEGMQDGLDRSVQVLVLFALVLIVVSALVSIAAARRVSCLVKSVQDVSDHYARGDFAKALNLTGFREAEDLSRSVNRMGRQLQDMILAIELRQQELQSMLEGMTAPVVLLDSALEIREINRAATNLVNRKAKQCRGRGLLTVFRSPELYDLARGVIDGGMQSDQLIRLDRESGTVYLQTNATLIHAGCLLVMNDVTRITRLEMMRKEFVANVSHELRTPITSILGFVETLQNSGDLNPDRRSSFLGIVHRQADRMVHIIDDLMSLSRLEEGDEQGLREDVNVSRLFDEAIEVLSFKAESKNIRIQRDTPKELAIPVFPVLAEQALVNLLDNAVKYGPEGSSVILKAERVGEEVIVTVKDEGPGIPLAELDRVFERFHRVDKARSRDLGGTGLGLAIVKHIAVKHGGRAWAESRPGAGSVFKIAFPLS